MPILVIKLGALGDFIQAYRAMTAIAAYHKGDRLTLLTIPSQRDLAEAFGLFDDIWTDTRPRLTQPWGWLALARRINQSGFSRIYDLQASSRTGFYFRLTRPPFSFRRVEWSGIASGCSHPHANPARTTLHNLERQADQLLYAGIDASWYPPLDTSWVQADVSELGIEGRPPYVLMVPGSAPAHPAKRWPAAHYAELARGLAAEGYRPVLLGTASEAATCAEIAAASPAVINLCDRSPVLAIMALARGAAGAVGNDTGPMHLIAAMGCPALTLFSSATNPRNTRPRGPYEGPGATQPPPGVDPVTTAVLRVDDLADLPVAEVRAAVLLRPPPR
ncbi:MAG: glycosyltransferase family 9 protein [Alphaproteobacteria bacterium]